MKRARVVTLNAALGPLDYRVPDGMAIEPGSVVVAPLGPRQLLGVAWEADRLPTNEGPDPSLPAADCAVRRPAGRGAASPPRRMGGGLLFVATRRGVAHGAAVILGARGFAATYRIPADRPGAGAPDAPADQGARCAGGPPGNDPRACGSSRGQRRRAARAGQRRRARSGGGRKR